MNKSISEADRTALVSVLKKLELAWNSGDSAAFGAQMSEDADFVTIRADHLHGRKEITASHSGIFSTIYAGSQNQLSLQSCKLLGENVALMHARSVLEAPTGPLAGRHEALLSAALICDSGNWQIVSFHISLVP